MSTVGLTVTTAGGSTTAQVGVVTDSVVTGALAQTGTGTAASVSPVIPAGAPIGGQAYLVHTSTSGLLPPAIPGWNVIAGPAAYDSNTLTFTLYAKAAPLVAGDLGAAVPITLSGSRVQAAQVFCVPGVHDAVSAILTQTAAASTFPVPAVTPGADGCVILAFAALVTATGVVNAAGVAPAPYTLEATGTTTDPTTHNVALVVASEQLGSGTQLVAVPQATFTTSPAIPVQSAAVQVSVRPSAPAAPTVTMYGAAPQGFSQSYVNAIVNTFNPEVIRTYDNPVPTGWTSTTDADEVPAGVILDESIKVNPGTLSTDPATKAAIADILHHLPGGSPFTNQHERENPNKGLDPAACIADDLVILDLIDAENATRPDPATHIDLVPTFMGYSLRSASNGGPTPARDIYGTYLCKDPRIKRVGFDCYDTADVQAAHDWCVAHGYRWIIPEYGFHASASTFTPVPNDQQYHDRIVADKAIWTQQPIAEIVLLFDQDHDAVESLPNTLNLWQSLIAASRAALGH